MTRRWRSSTTCGLFEKNLDQALALIDYQGFPARKAESKARGKLRGIGLASYIEACGIAPSNVAGALGARAGFTNRVRSASTRPVR